MAAFMLLVWYYGSIAWRMSLIQQRLENGTFYGIDCLPFNLSATEIADWQQQMEKG